MGKSVNDYYAEKMKKLLEMQGGEKKASIAPPQRVPSPKEKLDRYGAEKGRRGEAPHNTAERLPRISATNRPPRIPAAARRTENGDGRQYYEKFRTERIPAQKPYTKPKAQTAETVGKEQKNSAKRPRPKNPEQTAEDALREQQRKEEAGLRARRGKQLRRLRDMLITAVLVIAVVAVLCVVIYRLLFVISDINVIGAENYTPEEISAAAEIEVGDHLYSFRNSYVEQLITLRCPGISDVRVDKVAPSSVNLYITEEKPVFYADFYGEYRELSQSLRVLYATDKETAGEEGLILLKLPSVSSAHSGTLAEYSGVRNDSYIYEVTEALEASPLWESVRGVDLRNKYSISFNCDNKYLITLGDTENIETKLKIAVQVLKDPMFTEDVKAKVDVSDLSAASVVTDSKLDLDFLR